MEHQLLEELLEAIWTCSEEGRPTEACVLDRVHGEADREAFDRLGEQDLVERKGQEIRLTAKGEQAASSIIRRHRLAERLFTDVLGMSDEQLERAACSFEHAVVPEVTECICTLLGHPFECPHGKPIPRGSCCLEKRTEATRVLMSLNELPCNRLARLAYIRPGHHDRLHMLLSMGISPGTELRLHQKSPVLVVGIGNSEFAMAQEVAMDIYVWLEAEERKRHEAPPTNF